MYHGGTMLKIGTIVILESELLGNEKKAKGVCYDVKPDFELSFIIFENGNYDGFSDLEIERFLTVTEEVMDLHYTFKNVIELDQDFKKGVFNKAFIDGVNTDVATELEYLKWFRINADFGPGHSDVVSTMNEQFTEETKKKVPKGWRDD